MRQLLKLVNISMHCSRKQELWIVTHSFEETGMQRGSCKTIYGTLKVIDKAN